MSNLEQTLDIELQEAVHMLHSIEKKIQKIYNFSILLPQIETHFKENRSYLKSLYKDLNDNEIMDRIFNDLNKK